MEDTNKQDNPESARRLIKRGILPGSRPYEVFKPVRNENIVFEQCGRKYNEKQIANLYHQNRLHPKFTFEFRPPQLQSEIELLVEKYITKKPRDEAAIHRIPQNRR